MPDANPTGQGRPLRSIAPTLSKVAEVARWYPGTEAAPRYPGTLPREAPRSSDRGFSPSLDQLKSNVELRLTEPGQKKLPLTLEALAVPE